MYMRHPSSKPHILATAYSPVPSLPGLCVVVIRAILKLSVAGYLHKAAVAVFSFPVARPQGTHHQTSRRPNHFQVQHQLQPPQSFKYNYLLLTHRSASAQQQHQVLFTTQRHLQPHINMPAQRPSQLPPCPGPPPSRPLPPLPKRG